MTPLEVVLANLAQATSTPVLLNHGGRRRAQVIGRSHVHDTLIVRFVGRNGWSRTAHRVPLSSVSELLPADYNPREAK